MRKAVIASLLAATLLPSLAHAQPADFRDDHRREWQADGDRRDGPSRAEIRDRREDAADARREDRRDWREYRRAHPDVYRGPAWAGPRGYAYRPVPVGYRFRPDFYDRRYWVDPARYRLRPVYGPQRWIRYGNDVVLVNTRNGRVIEVNNGFFF